MPNRFPNLRRPESDHRNATAQAGLGRSVHQVLLGERPGDRGDLILSPFGTGTLKGPKLIRLSLGICKCCIETMPLARYLVQLNSGPTQILVAYRCENEVGKIIVNLEP